MLKFHKSRRFNSYLLCIRVHSGALLMQTKLLFLVVQYDRHIIIASGSVQCCIARHTLLSRSMLIINANMVVRPSTLHRHGQAQAPWKMASFLPHLAHVALYCHLVKSKLKLNDSKPFRLKTFHNFETMPNK